MNLNTLFNGLLGVVFLSSTELCYIHINNLLLKYVVTGYCRDSMCITFTPLGKSTVFLVKSSSLSVADIITNLSGGYLVFALIITILLSIPIRISVLTLRSWASSITTTLYYSSSGDEDISFSRIPSVMNFNILLLKYFDLLILAYSWLMTDLVGHLSPNNEIALSCYSLRQRNGRQSPWLSHSNCPDLSKTCLKEHLRYLSALTASSLSTHHCHKITIHGIHDLCLLVEDGQLLSGLILDNCTFNCEWE